MLKASSNRADEAGSVRCAVSKALARPWVWAVIAPGPGSVRWLRNHGRRGVHKSPLGRFRMSVGPHPITAWRALRGKGKTMEDKMLYTLTDVAAALSVGRSKVYELVRCGALPSVRIGGSRWVRGEDLATYVDSLELVPAARLAGAR